LREGTFAVARQRVRASRATPALWQWVGRVRRDESFFLEAHERGVNRANRAVALSKRAHFAADAQTIRIVIETLYREQHCELEVTPGGHRHM